MKNRQKRILNYIIENNKVQLLDLMDKFGISKRTLYYDIERINEEIQNCGQIKNVDRQLSYFGNFESLQQVLEGNGADHIFSPDERRTYILNRILAGQPVSIERLEEQLRLSKNTCISAMDDVKAFLKANGLQLRVKPTYAILGSELKIRDLFLFLSLENAELSHRIGKDVLAFNRENNLQLTDYSLSNLSVFLEFVRFRISQGNFVEYKESLQEARSFSFYLSVSSLLKTENKNEQVYLAAYISSLPSLNQNIKDDLMDEYIDRLVNRFESKTAIVLEEKEEFKKNIKRHLLSSYYRIKFQFPISNPSLSEIKMQHESLFRIMKSILENEADFPEFRGMREEEIGFITAYFGGYLYGSRDSGIRRNRVLLVCPNGLMVSKTLQIQLYKYIPALVIVDTIAVSQLDAYRGSYDYIISTVPLEQYDNVIIVNPFLTKMDLQRIMSKLIDLSGFADSFDMEQLLQVIRKNATITNEKQLKKDLAELIYHRTEKKKEGNPMLKDLIYDERINIVERVADWKEAITLAAQPLVKDKSIEPSYIDAMIESVNKYGPYIVLDDYFALPHAKANVGVNRLGMSLLVVRNAVDLCDNPVNVFLVLATVDKNSHLDALAELSDLLCERKNIDLFRTGTKEEILALINHQEA